MRLLLPLSLFLPLLCPTVHSQLKISPIPKEMKDMEGLHWHRKPLSDSNMRFQQLIGAPHMPIGKGKVVFKLGFRQEGFFTRVNFSKKTLNWTIQLSETTRTTASWTTTFASNHTSKPVTHYSGKISLPAYRTGQDRKLGPAVGLVRLSRPFVYQGGNFLVDITAKDPNNTNTFAAYYVDRTFGGSTTAKTTTVGFLSTSCPGGTTNGLGIYTNNMQPGGTCRTIVTNTSAPKTVAVLIVGTSLTNYGPIPLPFKLDALGGTGCYLMTDMLLTLPKATTFNATAKREECDISFPLPNNKVIEGLTLMTQFMVVDSKTNKLGLTFSGLAMRRITPNGIHTYDAGYHYWTGSGDVTKITSSSRVWNNRAVTMMIEHN